MKTVLIPVAGLTLVSGLVWRPFAAKNPMVELRKQAASQLAKSYAVLGKNKSEGSFYGLIKSSGIKRGNCYALASVLFKNVPTGAAAVVIKSDTYYCVCCINNGEPVLDQVFNSLSDALAELEAITKLLKITPRCNFDNQIGFQFVEGLEAKLIGPKKNRSRPISEVPDSPIKFILISGLLIGAGFWYMQAQIEEKERAETARLKAQQEADPVPKYMRNKMLEESKAAMPITTIYGMLAKLAAVDIKPEGWDLQVVKCAEYKCTLEYQRNLGMYVDLKLPSSFVMEYKSPVDLNKAFATASFETASFNLPDYTHTYEEFIKNDFGNLGQMWLIAGIGLSMSNPELWPMTPGVPPTFRHPMAIKAGSMKITNVPLPLLSNLLETKPFNVHVKSLEIKPVNKDGATDLTVNVDAFYHVKQ
ncbi:type 4b pilus protein PilO2 (plasmid) [Comamonas aquatica]|nr:type 4b pilus protein PilO2 [Comamonas aquatica]